MKPRFELPPKGKVDALVQATNHLEAAARSRRRALRLGWIHDFAYLRGIRQFRILWETGEVQASYKNDRGEMLTRYEDVLQKRQREIGRLMQIDTRPAIKPKGLGLDALRRASVAQVVLDFLESNLSSETIKQRFFEDLVDFGTAGLAVWVQESVQLGHQPIIEVVPAWELLPIPVEPARSYDVKGIIRDRWVTLQWLKDRARLKIPSGAKEADLEIRRVGPGDRIPGDSDPEFWRSRAASASGSSSAPRADLKARAGDLSVPWVYLREYWLEGEQRRVARYIVKAGNAILLDEDFSNLPEGAEPPVMPIAVAQYHSTGFFGRSFISPLIPINKQIEKMAANVFQNIIDLDLMGLRIIPTSSGITKRALQDLGRNRYLYADLDYGLPHMKPYALLPQNLGDMPIKTIAFGNTLVDRLSRESDMYSGQAPGRMDSARGLGVLYETSSIPLIPVTASIANAYKQVYEAMLQEGGTILKDQESIRLMILDDNVPGIQLNPQSGEMSLRGGNALPSPMDVIIDIRERLPRFAEKRKAELNEASQTGRIDPVDYIIIALKENLDIPLGNRSLIENIRTQWLENLIMFGDGKTPGTITTNTYMDNHKIHKRILEDFMARPEFRLASEEVRAKFLSHYQFHEEGLGSWPDEVPNPEALAEMPPDLSQAMSQGAGPPPNMMMGAGAGGPGMPPPPPPPSGVVG